MGGPTGGLPGFLGSLFQGGDLGELFGGLANQANQFGDASGFGGSSLFGQVSPLSFLGGFNNDPFLGGRIQGEVDRQGGGANLGGLLGFGPSAGNIGGPQAGARGAFPGAGVLAGAPGGGLLNIPNLPGPVGGMFGQLLEKIREQQAAKQGLQPTNFGDLKQRILSGGLNAPALGGGVAPGNSGPVGGSSVNNFPGNILSGIAGQSASAIPAQQTNTGGKDIFGTNFGGGIL